MTLAEALMARKDLVKKINKIKEDIASNLLTRSDLALPFDMPALFIRYDALQTELETINIKIDEANSGLIPALNQIRILDARIAFYSECRKKLLSAEVGFYTREETKYTRNADINFINGKLESLEQLRRAVDKEIQKTNWRTEISE